MAQRDGHFDGEYDELTFGRGFHRHGGRQSQERRDLSLGRDRVAAREVQFRGSEHGRPALLREKGVRVEPGARPLFDRARTVDVTAHDPDPVRHHAQVVHPGTLAGLRHAGRRLSVHPLGGIEVAGPCLEAGECRQQPRKTVPVTTLARAVDQLREPSTGLVVLAGVAEQPRELQVGVLDPRQVRDDGGQLVRSLHQCPPVLAHHASPRRRVAECLEQDDRIRKLFRESKRLGSVLGAGRPVLPGHVGDAGEPELDRDPPPGVVVNELGSLPVEPPGLVPFGLDKEQMRKTSERL